MKNQTQKLKVEMLKTEMDGGQDHGATAIHKASIAMMLLQRAEAEPAEDFVLAGMKKIIREGQQGGSLAVMTMADDMMEFIEDVENGRRRVEQICCAMR